MTSLFLECALRAVLIVAATAAVVWITRIKSAAGRHAAWTVAVLAMLVLPVWSIAGPKLSLPVLKTLPASPAIASTGPTVAMPATVPVDAPDTVAPSTSAATPVVDWQKVLVGFYALGAGVLLTRLGIGTIHTQRLRRSAVSASGRMVSSRCATPITVGWFSPMLILPAEWTQWSQAQLDAVLTHEGAHARRHDPLVQWLALLNRAVLWFHPLAWWLERRITALAEEACDAAVLAAGHSPQDYSRYLLDLARAVTREGRRLSVVGMAMPGSYLEPRLRRILDGMPEQSISRPRAACTIALCVLLSVMCAAGSLAPRVPAPGRQELRPATPATPRFEVASVKPCDGRTLPPGARGGAAGGRISPGRLDLDCQLLEGLIQAAYVIYATEESAKDPGLLYATPIEGAPDWIRSERYTIEAKAEGDASAEMMQGPMLRALLEDRFKLKVHHGTREVPMFALTAVKGGPKLTPFVEGSCVPEVITFPRTPPPAGQRYCERGGRPGGPNRVLVQEGITLDELCKEVLSGNPVLGLGRRVIDQTGISGKFVIHLEFARQTASADSTAPTLVTALQEQLGLKLEPIKGPGDVLVVDHVERPKPDGPFAFEGPKFDVVSVKPCKADDLPPGARGAGPRGPSPSPGRVHVDCLPLVGQNGLIRRAYGTYASGTQNAFLHPDAVPVEGGPDWVRTEHFTIDAKAVGTPRVELMMGPMLQAVLEDRFRLRVRRDTRQVPVYELTVAKGGPKLKPFDGRCKPVDFAKGDIPAQLEAEGSCPIAMRDTRVDAPGQTIADFITFVLTLMDRPVVDKTGLTGRFDIQLNFAPPDNSGITDVAATLAAAVQQQLGLKLVPAKGPGEILLIEHVERPSPDLPSPAALEKR